MNIYIKAFYELFYRIYVWCKYFVHVYSIYIYIYLNIFKLKNK